MTFAHILFVIAIILMVIAALPIPMVGNPPRPLYRINLWYIAWALIVTAVVFAGSIALH